MSVLIEQAPCFHAEAPIRGMLLADIDAATFARPRAMRARLRQGMAQLSVALHSRPDVREVIVVVWMGGHPAGLREMNLATAAAEAVHRRWEMLRGTPLAVAVVLTDDQVPAEKVRQRLRLSARTVPDGVSGMTWPDVCAYGVHASAAAYRL